MLKFVFLFMLSISVLFSVEAKTQSSQSAIYILQISSNLECETLNIQLKSEDNNSDHWLQYTTSAFGAVQVEPGLYEFGEVICESDETITKLNILEDRFDKLSLNATGTFYGGRLIFKTTSEFAKNNAPDVLSECTRSMSRARGDDDDTCRDGQGVDSSKRPLKKVELFIPDVSETDIKIVRDALSLTKEQFVYLPLQ